MKLWTDAEIPEFFPFWSNEMSETMFAVVVLPVLIFIARIIDVSIGTMRIIFLAKGKKVLVPVLGFFEVLVWVVAIGQVMQNLTEWYYYFAYAAGFATGNYVGMIIEEKLALGLNVFRIITRSDEYTLIDLLIMNGFGVTWNDGEGSDGPVKIIFTVIKRKHKEKVLDLINRIEPKPYYTIDEVRTASEEAFPDHYNNRKKRYKQMLVWRRRKEK